MTPSATDTAEVDGTRTREAVREEAGELDPLSIEFERSYAVLYRQALAKVGSPEVADDIVQEAFAKTARVALADGVRIRNMAAWLNRCVRNLSVSHLRERSTLPLDEEIVITHPDSAVDLAHARACCTEMYRAVERLTPIQRDAFLMVDIHGLPYEEVAENLNRSVGAIRQLLRRARTSVREAVGRDALAAALPLLRQSGGGVAEPAWGSGGIREVLAGRMGDLHAWFTSLVQRMGEATAQPVAAAAMSGALLAGALGIGVAVDPAGRHAGVDLQGAAGGTAQGVMGKRPVVGPTSARGKGGTAVDPPAGAVGGERQTSPGNGTGGNGPTSARDGDRSGSEPSAAGAADRSQDDPADRGSSSGDETDSDQQPGAVDTSSCIEAQAGYHICPVPALPGGTEPESALDSSLQETASELGAGLMSNLQHRPGGAAAETAEAWMTAAAPQPADTSHVVVASGQQGRPGRTAPTAPDSH